MGVLAILWACGGGGGSGRDARLGSEVFDGRILGGDDSGGNGGPDSLGVDGGSGMGLDADRSEILVVPEVGGEVVVRVDTTGEGSDGRDGDLADPVDATVEGDAVGADAVVVDGKPEVALDGRRDTGAARDVLDGAGREVARTDGRDGTVALSDTGLAEVGVDAAADLPTDLRVVDPTPPTVNGTVYTFTVGEAVFAVDAALGGRIIEFSLGGQNLLTAAQNASDNNWGSTFWTSPQSAWNWPPPVEIDSSPYTDTVVGGVLTLKGAKSNALGFSITKTFSVDSEAGAVLIDYAITNLGTVAKSVAPWEISRVAAAGLTFFPMGEGSPRKGSPTLLSLQLSGGVAWLDYATVVATTDQKVFADGAEGWLAHVNGDLLFVKAFGNSTVVQAAPGEGEIELFTDAPHTYIEVENQGAYAPLAPGATTVWHVRWFLRKLAPTVPMEVDSADLLATVRALVGG